mgnify:CR=1 FL=1
MEINEYVLKLSGKASLPEALELSHSYKIEIDGAVTTSTDSDNHDGTCVRYFKYEPILVKILKDNGETIKAKDTRSRSKLFRALLWKEWKNMTNAGEFETFYDEIYEVLMEQVPEVMFMWEAKRKRKN